MGLQDHAKQLQDILAPQGFSRKSSTWRRDSDAFIDVIEFDKQRAKDDSFTVNIGVLTKSVHEIAWGEASPALPKQSDCTVHAPQLSTFFDRGQWWKLGDPTASPQIADHVRNLVLPFMDRMHSRVRVWRTG